MVSDDLTGGPQPAPAQTGVLAGVDETGEVRGTVSGDDTLRSAVWGGPVVSWDTGADTAVPHHPLVTVGTTVVVTAGLSDLWLSFYSCESINWRYLVMLTCPYVPHTPRKHCPGGLADRHRWGCG